MQYYIESYLYNNKSILENFQQDWCTNNLTPPHFEICPSSSKTLKKLCSENSIFINQFVHLESLFLKQEKLYLCGKLDKQEALKIMYDLSSKLSNLIDYNTYLSHHQSHLDVVLGNRNDMPSNKMNKSKLCSSI